MKKLLQSLFVLLLIASSAIAQNRTVSGTVTSKEDGLPLPGVSVKAGGTSAVTQTNVDGKYTISVPSTAKTLEFSYIGYTKRTLAITSVLNVTLVADNQSLQDVVVTAYGTVKRQNFTGTAATVGSTQIKDQLVSNIGNVLQGQASGVVAVNSTGQPGANPTIRVRGIASANASSDPLIVLDGAIYGGHLNNINPNDIESITIGKDATATSLYGSRAAAGVLFITSKTGSGKPKIDININSGFSNRAVKDYEYLGSQGLYETTWEGLRNQALITPALVTSSGSASAADYASKTVAPTLVYNPYNLAQPVGLDGKLVAGANALWNQDWADALLRTGKRTDVNGAVSGASDKTRYYIGGGYLSDQGLATESQFKRYSGRVKLDNQTTNWLKVGANVSGSFSTQNYPNQAGSGYSNVISWIRTVSSIYPEYLLAPTTGQPILDANGNKQYDFGNNGPLLRPVLRPGNPAATTSMNPTTYDRYLTSLNGYAEAKIIDGLTIRSQYALDYYQYAFDQYYNPFVGDGAAYSGRSEKYRETTITQTLTNTATYDKTFGVHHLNLLAGWEVYKYKDNYTDAEARGFTFPGTTELSYGATPYTASSNTYLNRQTSFFGRASYDYKDKYHVTGSVRGDGNSRFAENVRWATFYSVGASWNVNRESFLSDVKALSDLKLRASYGTTGNQALLNSAGSQSYFPYLGVYTGGANIAGYSGSYILSAANDVLTWEKQTDLDLGIDFGVLKNRISGSFTYFNKKSKGLLFNRPLAPSSGLNGVNDNIGQLSNKGIEVELTTRNFAGKDFQWTTSINFTHIRNKITSLPQPTITGSNFSQLSVGESLYNFYLRDYAGVDPADGRPMWYLDQTDANGNITQTTTKTYSAATRYYKGTALPNATGGINNTFSYKNFDLNVLASFSFGGKIYDSDYAGLMHAAIGTNPGYNWSVDILNRWQSASNPGDGVTPRLTGTTDDQATSASTRFLYDASYGRIRNITLGYRLPQRWLDKVKFAHARIFADYQNPFTIFGRKGLDPEQGIAGVTNNASVVYKTLSFGVNFGF
ncbi:TonB-dependent receptor [Pedobacter jeongneungensis]|uniref:TonB-dependent receptor n=1 Tax=Pedobacter jeongneungensis TaxID=947309 RepID=A0ABP8BDG9_9SPHI